MGQPDPTQPNLQPNWHEPLFNPFKMTRFDLQPVWPVYKPINPTWPAWFAMSRNANRYQLRYKNMLFQES